MIDLFATLISLLIIWGISFGFIFTFVIILGFLRAFIFHKFWIWFVVPILHVPEISIIQIFLLLFVLNFLTGSIPREKKAYTNFIFNYLVLLFLGYILKIIFGGSL